MHHSDIEIAISITTRLISRCGPSVDPVMLVFIGGDFEDYFFGPEKFFGNINRYSSQSIRKSFFLSRFAYLFSTECANRSISLTWDSFSILNAKPSYHARRRPINNWRDELAFDCSPVS